jgi:hypothetical protein
MMAGNSNDDGREIDRNSQDDGREIVRIMAEK